MRRFGAPDASRFSHDALKLVLLADHLEDHITANVAHEGGSNRASVAEPSTLACRLRYNSAGCETIFHMAEDEENQPPEPDEAQAEPGDKQNQRPEHEAPPEPAANKPTIARPEQAEEEPKVQAGKPKSEDSKSDWRHTLITAAISALAALLGAAVGGLFSYLGSHSQSVAQTDAALIKGRQTTYSDYMTEMVDLADTEHVLVDNLRHFHYDPDHLDQLNSTVKQYNDDGTKAKHTDYIVSLNASDAVDNIRDQIAVKQKDIHGVMSRALDQAYGQKPVEIDLLNDLYSKIDAVSAKFDDFTNAARADVEQPNRRLFS
jgi:hypothetical protein